MPKCFIIFGRLNKRLLLPLFASLIQIINVIIKKQFDVESGKFFNFLFLIAISLGQISIRLYPYILKISNKKDENINISKKKEMFTLFYIKSFIYF